MRNRSRTSPVTFASGSWVDTSRTGVITSGTAAQYSNTVQSMTDQVNPGYFMAEREGKLKPVAPMSSRKLAYLAFNGQFRGRQPHGGGFITYERTATFLKNGQLPVAPSVPLSTINPEPLLQAALARAQTDAWDTATFLAELGKTIEGLTTFYSRWKMTYDKVVRAAKRRQKRFSTFADAFADAWLEARYSIRPLVYDMRDISEAVQRLLDGVDSPLARGWESDSVEDTGVRSIAYAGAIYSSVLQGEQVTSCGGRLSSAVDFFNTNILSTRTRKVTGKASVGVQVNTRAISMFDPAVTAWEVVPFSFIADWFINIGEAIAAFSPFATGTFKYATFSVMIEDVVTHSGYVSSRPGGSAIVEFSNPSTLTITETTYTRTLHTVTPNLSFKVNLNAAKIIDLVALAWALTKSYRKLVSITRL